MPHFQHTMTAEMFEAIRSLLASIVDRLFFNQNLLLIAYNSILNHVNLIYHIRWLGEFILGWEGIEYIHGNDKLQCEINGKKTCDYMSNSMNMPIG